MQTPCLKYSADAATHVPAWTHAGWALAPNETIIWQGRPTVRAIAEHVLYAPWIAGYFALLIAARALQTVFFAGPARLILAPLVPAAAVAILIAAMAIALVRTTRYVVTSHRIIVRYGAALPRSLSVPFSQVRSLSLSLDRGTRGDIAIATQGALGVPALKLWPHLRRAKPHIELRFRGISDAAQVATQLARMLAAAETARRTHAEASLTTAA